VEDLLEKILRDMAAVPEGKLSIPFDDIAPRASHEERIGTLTLKERQLAVIVREYMYQADACVEAHMRQYHGAGESHRDSDACRRFQQEINHLDMLCLEAKSLLTAMVLYRLGPHIASVGIRRGGILVKGSDLFGALQRFLENSIARRESRTKETRH